MFAKVSSDLEELDGVLTRVVTSENQHCRVTNIRWDDFNIPSSEEEHNPGLIDAKNLPMIKNTDIDIEIVYHRNFYEFCDIFADANSIKPNLEDVSPSTSIV